MPRELFGYGAFVPYRDFGQGQKSSSRCVFLNGARGTLVATNVER